MKPSTIHPYLRLITSSLLMTVEQLLNAARMVKPKVLFPYHYGQTDVTGIPSQLESDGIEFRIRQYE